MTHSQEEFYRELVTEYYPALLRYATQVLQDSFLAEDVVMDTLHTAFEKIDILYNAENPRAWLYAVLKNKLGNCIKKQSLSQSV
jgi:DNA-directed RNA polymerase specialized sigma24 family protein